MLQQIMRAAGLPGRASAHSTNSCCAASMHGAAACIARAWLSAALDQGEAKLCFLHPSRVRPHKAAALDQSEAKL